MVRHMYLSSQYTIEVLNQSYPAGELLRHKLSDPIGNGNRSRIGAYPNS